MTPKRARRALGSAIHTSIPGTRRPTVLRTADPVTLHGLTPDPDHAWRHDNIGRLLVFAFNLFEERMLELITQRGYGDLRYIHMHLFRNVDYQGTRIVDLAKRAGITKAAMGQLVKQCERLGYVTIDVDPKDGRARIVTPTASGRRLLRDFGKVVQDLEEEFRRVLKPSRYKSLRAALNFLRSEALSARRR